MMIKWVPSPNFTPGRGGMKPDMIVIHVMEGTLAGTDSWFGTPKSGVSAHYGIGLNRKVHQYVSEDDQAWHAGRVSNPSARLVLERPGVNPNRYSIGIEHEGTATSVWPATMYEDSARLVVAAAQRWDIPIDRDHVVGHRKIYGRKTCPGAGDVDRIVAEALRFVSNRAGGIMEFGSRGEDVRDLQRRLKLREAHQTGYFGPVTLEAVKLFQWRHGLVADGVVGPKTWQALNVQR